jgi:hypothetical protein
MSLQSIETSQCCLCEFAVDWGEPLSSIWVCCRLRWASDVCLLIASLKESAKKQLPCITQYIKNAMQTIGSTELVHVYSVCMCVCCTVHQCINMYQTIHQEHVPITQYMYYTVHQNAVQSKGNTKVVPILHSTSTTFTTQYFKMLCKTKVVACSSHDVQFRAHV